MTENPLGVDWHQILQGNKDQSLECIIPNDGIRGTCQEILFVEKTVYMPTSIHTHPHTHTTPPHPQRVPHGIPTGA